MPKKEWGDVCTRVDTCALAGVAAFAAGIPEADIIANGPLWCYFYALRPLEKVNNTVARRFTGTQPDNNSVVFGTESCLGEELARRKTEGRSPSLLLVENSCSVSLIGDDIAGILNAADLGYPTLAVDSGGLKGGFAEGYSLAGLKLLQELNLHRQTVKPRTVNILGATPFYYNGTNDWREIKRILTLANLEVVSTPGCYSTLAEIQQITSAAYNIVLHEELGLEQAKYLEANYGMPYKSCGIPYGLEGTLQWLRDLELEPQDLVAVTAQADQLQEALYNMSNELRMAWQELWFDEIIISGPVTMALSLASALRLEIADAKRLVVMAQHKPLLQKASSEIDELIIATEEPQAIAREFKDFTNGLLLASSSERNLLAAQGKYSYAALNIANPSVEEIIMTDQPFVGLRGAMNLAEKIWHLKIRRIIEESRL